MGIGTTLNPLVTSLHSSYIEKECYSVTLTNKVDRTLGFAVTLLCYTVLRCVTGIVTSLISTGRSYPVDTPKGVSTMG